MLSCYHTELSCSESCSHFKGNRKGLHTSTNDPKAVAVLHFALSLATFEGRLFLGARLGIRVFERVPGTFIVSLNKSLSALTFCTKLFHVTVQEC